jgi:isopenicillin N synthase-like dioxygenase
MGSIEEPVHVIPTIDLSPWLQDGASEESKAAVVTELHNACVTYGFFQLVGHGIPIELQTKVLHCAAEFFDLPLEEKLDVSIKKAMGQANRGYEVLAGQTLQTGALPDLKEVGRSSIELDVPN